MLLVAVFLVLGQHLPSLLTAWQDPTVLTEYSSSPTPFWMVKLMDLGIIVPVAVTEGIGLLTGARWAHRIVHPILTGYACLAASVAAMAVVMNLNADPDASVGLATGILMFAMIFSGLAVALYPPIFHRGGYSPGRTVPHDGFHRVVLEPGVQVWGAVEAGVHALAHQQVGGGGEDVLEVVAGLTREQRGARRGGVVSDEHHRL